MSQSVSKSALVPYSAEQMYALVADIESYPNFLSWCSATEILEADANADVDSETEEQVIARVDINFRGVKQSFTTSNINQPSQSIFMSLHESAAFNQMQGQWRFIDLGDGCKVEFELEFSIRSNLLAGVIGKVFGHIASTQIDGFVKRAQELY